MLGDAQALRRRSTTATAPSRPTTQRAKTAAPAPTPTPTLVGSPRTEVNDIAALDGGSCRTWSRQLAELGDILGLLRQPGEPDHPTAPAPGLAPLPGLVAATGAAGLAVDWSVRSHQRASGPVVDLVAYRVPQEALTNAHKHGTGTAAVIVDHGETPLSLTALTDREREVVAQVAHGLTDIDIAARLFLSPLTIKPHNSRAMTTVDARDRAQLVVAAFQSGLVRPRTG